MRRLLRPLKVSLPPAETRHMAPSRASGGGILISLVPLLVLPLVLALVLAAGGVWSAPAAASSADGVAPSPATGDATQGEMGGGPQIPAPVIPPSSRRAAQLAGSRFRWSDVRRTFWARRAIDYVGKTHDWMHDFQANRDGTVPFKPNATETRKLLFRAAARALAPNATPNRDIRFSDLDRSAPFYRWASIAVKLGWADKDSRGRIRPDRPATMAVVDHVLVYALGLREVARGLNGIHTHDGDRFKTWGNFGSTVLALRMYLRKNHNDESMDVLPSDPMPRAEVAYSLFRAATISSSTVSDMDRYRDIELPDLSAKMRQVVQFGIRYAGYPYIWGGEWPKRTGSGYCCGAQPTGGFDCSGFTWWLLKEQVSGWDPTPPRPYRGWSLPQRVSRDMASAGRHIHWNEIRPGDALFYDFTHDGVVDHVDTYVGNGWALDSSSSPGGVTFMWVGTGAYHDNFEHARRIVG